MAIQVSPDHPIDYYAESDRWEEVYSVRTYKEYDPIPGTYYQTGSGEWLIASTNNDNVYRFSVSHAGRHIQRLTATTLYITSIDLGYGSNVSYIRPGDDVKIDGHPDISFPP